MKMEYYATHSVFTDPAPHYAVYEDLPDDLDGLREKIQGLLIHHYDGPLYHLKFNSLRYAEIDLRFVSKILTRLLKMDDQSLLQGREPFKRVVSSCRDYSILLCSVLRSRNIPARLRYGFTTYLYKNFNHDQVMVEYWDAAANLWRFVDVRTSKIFIEKKQLDISFSLNDVPEDKFIQAGEAWKLCRQHGFNPNKFGAGLNNNFRGIKYIADKVIQDFAALNKREMLLWDYWGIMLNELNMKTMPNLVASIDNLAELCADKAVSVAEVNHYYNTHAEFNLSSPVISFTLHNEPYEFNFAGR